MAYDANGLQTQANGAESADDRISEYDAFHRLTHTVVGSPLTPSDFRTYFYAPDLSLARQIEYNSAQISRKPQNALHRRLGVDRSQRQRQCQS